MMTGQTTGAAKPGRLGKTGNASCHHFFPALKGRVAADAQLHTVLGKAIQALPRTVIAGSSPRNAMTALGIWGIQAK